VKKLLTTLTALSILLIATASYAQTYTVERVIDGDTIVVTTPEGKSEKVRLIGIDAPESQPNDKAKRDAERTGKDLKTINKMGKKATEFTKSLITTTLMKVELEFDVQKRDKYGRLLAYAYLKEGMTLGESFSTGGDLDPFQKEKRFIIPIAYEKGLFINANIIKYGYATPMTIPPNVKYADLFQELYEEARENKRGLWKSQGIPVGPKSEEFFKRVAEDLQKVSSSQGPMMVDSTPQCDLNSDGDCNDEDFEIFKKSLGKCSEEFKTAYDFLSDIDASGCVTELDQKFLFDEEGNLDSDEGE